MGKEIGMLFSGEMVRAILDGRKTRTCRIINPQPRVILAQYYDGSIETNQIFRHGDQRLHCRVQPGDRIYVRETFAYAESPEYPANRDYKPVDTNFIYPVETDGKVYVIYRADGDTSWGSFDGDNLNKDGTEKSYWRPSIHMPRWAARIRLVVTEVKAQRPQDLTDEEIMAEGIAALTKDGNLAKYGLATQNKLGELLPLGGEWAWNEWKHSPREAWRKLWTQCYGPEAWEKWCWAISFKRIEVK